jgi:outer membrane protein assembly factor BamB
VAAISFWYYAVSNGCLYLGIEGESIWTTGPAGLQTAPAVKPGLRKVWAGSATGDLLTLDAETGKVLKTVSFSDAVYYAGCHGPNLVAGLSDGSIFAIDPGLELTRWSARINGPVMAAAETTGVLLVQPFEATPTAYDANTGAVLWQAPYEAGSISADDGVFYLTNFNELLEARRAADGAVLWSSTSAPTFNYAGVSSYEGTVYVTSEDLKIHALSGATGQQLWSADTPSFSGAPMYASLYEEPAVVIAGYGNGGDPPSPGIAAYDAATGKQRWNVGPLPGGDTGEQPAFPVMRLWTSCVGLPNEGLIYSYDGNGNRQWKNRVWNVGPGIAGLAYLTGMPEDWPV